jgi:hexosaminidase
VLIDTGKGKRMIFERAAKVCGLMVMAFCANSFAVEGFRLVPMPREIVATDGTAHLSAEWKICINNNDCNDNQAAMLLAEEVKSCCGWNWEIVCKMPPRRYILLRVQPLQGHEPDLYKEQGYSLTVEAQRIIVEAPTVTGRFYGIQTLRQLIRASSKGKVSQLAIVDYPALEVRGISDDVSRGQMATVEDFKSTIRQLAFYKMNLYQPYIEDLFEFSTDPYIGSGTGRITKDEMAQIAAEAKRNHMILAPVFECLGHQSRLLAVPGLREYGEIDQRHGELSWVAPFQPADPNALEFVKRLIDEMSQACSSPFFHIGGDEAYLVGTGRSKHLVEKIGKGRVFAEYFTQLHDYITSRHHRRMMLYGDSLLEHPETLQMTPKDCIIVDWHYGGEEFPSVRTLKNAGFTSIVASPNIWAEDAFYPEFGAGRKGLKNIGAFAAAAKQEKILGVITSRWGGSGDEDLRENGWLGYAFTAAASWQKDIPDTNQFVTFFSVNQYGTDLPMMAEAERLLGWQRHSALYADFHTVTLRAVKEDQLQGMKVLRADMQQVRSFVRRLRGQVRYCDDHLDSMDLVARRYLYMIERDMILDQIARVVAQKKWSELPSEQQAKIVSELVLLREELKSITAEFERLWLRHNKFPDVGYHLKRLHSQIVEIQDLIYDAKDGRLTVKP